MVNVRVTYEKLWSVEKLRGGLEDILKQLKKIFKNAGKVLKNVNNC